MKKKTPRDWPVQGWGPTPAPGIELHPFNRVAAAPSGHEESDDTPSCYSLYDERIKVKRGVHRRGAIKPEWDRLT